MKRLSRILFLAAVLSGCMKVEVYRNEEPVPLGFDVYSAHANDLSKADGSYVSTSTGHLPSGSEFGVFGFFHSQNGDAAGSWQDAYQDNATVTNHPNLMYNQKVSVTESGGVYTYDYTPKRFWPLNEKETISFFAYYPYDETGTVIKSDLSKDSNGMGTLRFKCSEDVKEQVDFLVSDLCMDQQKTGNNPVLTGSAPDDEGKVRFTFHHMLAQVRVNVINVVSENPKITIDENSFKFTFYGFPVAGNCIPTPGAKQINGLAPCTFSWSGLLSTVQERVNGQDVLRESEMQVPSYNPSNPDAGFDDFLLIIPHEVQDNERLEVVFDLERAEDHGESYEYANNPLFGYLKNKLPNNKFEANKIYTFNLTVGLNEIKFDASVENWTSGSGDLVFK